MNPWFRLLPLLLVFSGALSLTMPGCKPREEVLQTTGALEFSADTVKFDTVFTTIRTVTKRLWVYNRNPKAVSVDLVSLENPAASPYTLIINGDLKQTASGLYIRGQDSLLILVRAQLRDNGQNGAAKGFVVQENLNFRANGLDQRVLLRSFGQNIYLHQHVALPCNSVWTNDRPHVLYDTVLVPAGCTLRLKPGTRVYAHAGAVLIVQGTLLVNSDFNPGAGATDTVKAGNTNVVRFAGDRSGEAQFATAPGQWGGIEFYPGSHGNVIRYAQIQNASFGLFLLNPANQLPRPDILVQNSTLRYISGNGIGFAGAASNSNGYPGAAILSIVGSVKVENTLFSDCYESAILGIGGDYLLNYCTIANYPAVQAVRSTASLYFTDVSATSNPQPYPLAVTLTNSIVWGNVADELAFGSFDRYAASVFVGNNLLKSQLYQAATDAPGTPGLAKPGLDNLLNQDPKFVRVNAGSRSDYRLASGSPAQASKTALPPFVLRDLLNLPRPAAPDLGAYQSGK